MLLYGFWDRIDRSSGSIKWRRWRVRYGLMWLAEFCNCPGEIHNADFKIPA